MYLFQFVNYPIQAEFRINLKFMKGRGACSTHFLVGRFPRRCSWRSPSNMSSPSTRRRPTSPASSRWTWPGWTPKRSRCPRGPSWTKRSAMSWCGDGDYLGRVLVENLGVLAPIRVRSDLHLGHPSGEAKLPSSPFGQFTEAFFGWRAPASRCKKLGLPKLSVQNAQSCSAAKSWGRPSWRRASVVNTDG